MCPAHAREQRQPARAAATASIDVYFSPNGGATDAIVRELRRAKKRVRVQAYSFTSAPIAKALVEAKRRGVDVTVVLDASQKTDKCSSATFLYNQGVPVLIDAEHAIAHNKVILIDADVKAAEERNAENLLVIRNAEFAGKYQAHFEKHLGALATVSALAHHTDVRTHRTKLLNQRRLAMHSLCRCGRGFTRSSR